MPKVSVIVPNYNHAPYLKQRFESIFNQTFQNFEVIILDDCSTDNSKEIIEKYRNKPQVSHIVYNETNSGSPFKQWAKGLELARGEYIWIAESDDWAETDFIEKSSKILDKDNTLALTFCNSYNECGTSITQTENTFPSSKKIDSPTMLSKHLCWGCTIYNASSVLFRLSFAKKLSSDYQSFQTSGDYFFWILLSEQGGVYYNFEALNHYRMHSQNTSLIKRKNGIAFLEDLKIFTYITQKGYLTFYEKQVIVLANLKKIKENIDAGNREHQLLLAYSLWRKKIVSVFLSTFFVYFGEKIWNLFKNNTAKN